MTQRNERKTPTFIILNDVDQRSLVDNERVDSD
jgi:hypothetical protein